MSVTLVVPCYNEAGRWQADYWRELVRPGDLDVLFVDDGSTDATRAVVQETVEETGEVRMAGVRPGRRMTY